MSQYTPQDLKQILSSGLLSFPLTDFDEQGDFRPKTYIERLEWLAPMAPAHCSPPAAPGEFFSLVPGEYSDIIKHRRRHLPWQGAHHRRRRRFHPRGHRLRPEAERLGAHGILLMPTT
jgi:5-dehydro-4-deoxyglucarate dehydratase